MADEQELWLESLDEWVLDDHKLVSYRWLANELRISCEVAKRSSSTLEKFYDSRGSSKINATYILSGRKTKNALAIFSFTLVSAADMEDKKAEFATLHSCRIYSVAPASQEALDMNKLFTAQQQQANALMVDESENAQAFRRHSAGIIEPPKSISRKERVIHKKGKFKPPPNVVKAAPKIVPRTSSGMSSSAKRSIADSISSKFASRPRISSNKPSNSKSTASFFGTSKRTSKHQITGNSSPRKANQDTNKTTKSTTVIQKKAGGSLRSFFGKAASQATKKAKEASKASSPAVKSTNNNKKKTKRLRKYVSSSDEEDSEEPMIPHRTTSHIAKTEAPEATQSKDKRKPKHSKVEAVETRHKAFQDMLKDQANGDSDLEFDTRTEEDLERERAIKAKARAEEEAVREQEAANATAPIFTGSNPAKKKTKRKLVKRTYVDEDGYMVTNDVWEEQEDDNSDTETTQAVQNQQVSSSVDSGTTTTLKKTKSGADESKSKRKAKSINSAKKVEPQGKKQRTMMNFFKKL